MSNQENSASPVFEVFPEGCNKHRPGGAPKSAQSGSSQPSPPMALKGSRRVHQLPDSAFSKDVNSIRACFEPYGGADRFPSGALLVCRFTGTVAHVVGVHSTGPPPGQQALYLELDCLNGSVPFATNAAFFARWWVMDRPILSAGEKFTVPTGTILPSCARSASNCPLTCQSRIPSPFAVDIAATAMQGLEVGMIVMHEAKSQTTATTTTSTLNKSYMIIGYTPCAENPNKLCLIGKLIPSEPGTTPTTTPRKKSPSKSVSPSSSAYEELAPGEAFVVISRYTPRRFNPEYAQQERASHVVSSILVPEDPQHPVQLTFKYPMGVKSSHTGLFDANPERCKFYFGVEPGERVSHPVAATCIGMAFADQGVLGMFYHCDGRDGAGVFSSKGDPPVKLQLIGEVRTVKECFGLCLNHYPPIQATAETSRFIVPDLDTRPAARLNCTFSYLSGGAEKLELDVDCLEKEFGVKQGQRFALGGRTVTVLGVGAKPRGMGCCMWFQAEGDACAGILTAGEALQLFKGEVVSIFPIQSKAITYKALQRSELPSDLPALVHTFCWPCGRGGTVLKLFDADPGRCGKYFPGLVPGTRVENIATVIGMAEDHGKVSMYFQKDADFGCGLFKDGTDICIIESTPLIKLVSHVQGRLVISEAKEEDPSFPYHAQTKAMLGTGKIVRQELVDARPKTVKYYFGVIPGQRVDGHSTVVGIQKQERKLRLFLHVDGNPGAGVNRDGSALCVQDDVVEMYFPDEAEEESNEGKEQLKVDPRDKPLDPKMPLVLNFPSYSGLGDRTYVTYYDIRPEVIHHYYPGLVSGTRLVGGETVVGLRHGKESQSVSLWCRLENCKGAGRHTDEEVFIDDEDTYEENIVPLEPAPVSSTVFPAPSHPVEKLTLPTPTKELVTHFSKIFIVSGNAVLVDIDCLSMLTGGKCKFGQRGYNELTPITVLGVALVQDELHYIAVPDGLCATLVNGGSVLSVSQDVVQISAPRIRCMNYVDRKLLTNHTLREDTRYKSKGGSIAFLDKSPETCFLYFGVVPGQRIDGMATVIGVRTIGSSDTVELVAAVDGVDGAGTWSSGTTLWVEELELESAEVGQSINASTTTTTPRKRKTVAEECLLPNTSSDRAGDRPTFPYTESDSGVFSADLPSAGDEALIRLQAAAAFPISYPSNIHALNHVRTNGGTTGLDDRRRKLEQKLASIPALKDVAPNTIIDTMTKFLSHEVPLVSWFKPMKIICGISQIELMTNDVSFRSLFETNHSNGLPETEVREKWEAKRFGGQYDGCPPIHRPKYGLLNLFNDPEGPRVPRDQYGDCFFVFTEDVRTRVTMTAKDSGNARDMEFPICTVDQHTVAVFDDFQDKGKELETFASIVCGKECYAKSAGTFYKEAQLHQALYLDSHVFAIVVADHYLKRPADLHLFLNFAMKNACWLVTPSTLRILAKKRLDGEDALKAEVKGLVEDGKLHWAAPFFSATSSSSSVCVPCININSVTKVGKILCRPQEEGARRWYEVLTHYYLVEEWAKVQNRVCDSHHTQWRKVDAVGGKRVEEDASDAAAQISKMLAELAGGRGDAKDDDDDTEEKTSGGEGKADDDDDDTDEKSKMLMELLKRGGGKDGECCVS